MNRANGAGRTDERAGRSDADLRDEAEARQRRGTRQLLMARAVFMVFSYLSSVILARILGPAGFGIYGVLISLLVWLEMVGAAGVPGALGKLIPDRHEDADLVEGSALFLLLPAALVLLAAGWLAAPAVARVFDLRDGARLFRLAILDIPFAVLYAGYSGMLMGRRLFGLLSVSQTILGAAKLLGITALIVLGVSVERALIVNVAASCAALLVLVVRHRSPRLRSVERFVHPLVSIGIPIAVFAVALQVLTSIDLWSLGSLWEGSDAVLGWYVAALKIGQTLMVIPVVQSGVVLSSVAWALARHDHVGAHRHVLEASRFALLLTVPACVIVGTSASPLMALIYSTPYAAGGRFLALQLAAFSCFAFLDAFAHALMAAGRQRMTAVVLVAFVPVVAVANLLLIPRVGPMGAAAALLVGMLGVAVAMGVMVWRWLGAPFDARTLFRVVLAGAIVFVPSAWFQVEGPVVLLKLVILGGLYLLVLWRLGEISAADFVLPSVDSPAGA